MKLETVIVAFESGKSCERIRDILESSGTAECIVCHSAAEVKRTVSHQRVTTVICGFKLPDQTAQDLFEDLPTSCAMLMVANQAQLDLCANPDIFKLAAPVGRGDIVASVRMLLQFAGRMDRYVRPRRSQEEEQVIHQAKQLLMARHGMSEEQAHRLLQKRSMDTGARMIQTARLVLEEH